MASSDAGFLGRCACKESENAALEKENKEMTELCLRMEEGYGESYAQFLRDSDEEWESTAKSASSHNGRLRLAVAKERTRKFLDMVEIRRRSIARKVYARLKIVEDTLDDRCEKIAELIEDWSCQLERKERRRKSVMFPPHVQVFFEQEQARLRPSALRNDPQNAPQNGDDVIKDSPQPQITAQKFKPENCLKNIESRMADINITYVEGMETRLSAQKKIAENTVRKLQSGLKEKILSAESCLENLQLHQMQQMGNTAEEVEFQLRNRKPVSDNLLRNLQSGLLVEKQKAEKTLKELQARLPDGATAGIATRTMPACWSSVTPDAGGAGLAAVVSSMAHACREKEAALREISEGLNEALGVAARSRSVDEVKALLDAGADPDAALHAGLSALCVAALHGRLRILLLLVERGADVGFVGADGLSAVHCAAKRGHAQAVRLLVTAGASVTAPVATTGETPLHLAASRGHAAAVRALLAAGAPTSVRCRLGWTPLEVAQTDEVRAALQE